MIHVELYEYMRTATEHAREFIDAHRTDIEKAILIPIPIVHLKDGEVYWFMSYSAYRTWCIGRDYEINDVHYHSDFRI